MRGHEELIRMRMSGKKPTCVFIDDLPRSSKWIDCGEFATICTHKDRMEDIDLRCVVGLVVSISSDFPERALELVRMARDAGAVSIGYGTPDLVGIWHKGIGDING